MAGGDYQSVQSPFDRSATDDARFGKLVLVAVVLCSVLALVLSLITLPEIEREEKQKLPPQLARVLLEKEEIDPPPPLPEPEQAEPEPEKPEPVEEPEPVEQPEPVPEPEPTEVEKAREVAKVSGVLQFQDALADMRNEIDTAELTRNEVTHGAAEAQVTERDLITSGAESDSGGINTAALSTDTANTALAGRETTQVESPLAGADSGVGTETAEPARRAGERSDEEIRQVMSQHASALDRYYRRALRSNPALQGKIVLKLVINPDGSLADVVIVSSGLNDPELEAKVLARVKLISFPAREDVVVTSKQYTFNFLPQL
ncbi:AgmX/PglI C-terminal domain-containing protein [Gilvimarinus agarilyticus]|uniref:AgmX/PglI C-terminal domain-containing protein n=1 Tax=Gilvimarinus sp. 2_MG-2023 TaxID=3062666 RepID=UPI001C08B101|nr:AgmX/PglI C-terminal domain-containing protein [Gilvimarinus sp. 2_MG-2023]MBU2886226.1 AgmX/PglI C-terminal domain-containing protein [Gilvimarinus agarilyticus]MDO6570914.1 AgmX/PglI C-terminal domain-containing protein [Gilvimarinus sp. 2_MG-2023]